MPFFYHVQKTLLVAIIIICISLNGVFSFDADSDMAIQQASAEIPRWIPDPITLHSGPIASFHYFFRSPSENNILYIYTASTLPDTVETYHFLIDIDSKISGYLCQLDAIPSTDDTIVTITHEGSSSVLYRWILSLPLEMIFSSCGIPSDQFYGLATTSFKLRYIFNLGQGSKQTITNRMSSDNTISIIARDYIFRSSYTIKNILDDVLLSSIDDDDTYMNGTDTYDMFGAIMNKESDRYTGSLQYMKHITPICNNIIHSISTYTDAQHVCFIDIVTYYMSAAQTYDWRDPPEATTVTSAKIDWDERIERVYSIPTNISKTRDIIRHDKIHGPVVVHWRTHTKIDTPSWLPDSDKVPDVISPSLLEHIHDDLYSNPSIDPITGVSRAARRYVALSIQTRYCSSPSSNSVFPINDLYPINDNDVVIAPYRSTAQPPPKVFFQTSPFLHFVKFTIPQNFQSKLDISIYHRETTNEVPITVSWEGSYKATKSSSAAPFQRQLLTLTIPKGDASQNSEGILSRRSHTIKPDDLGTFGSLVSKIKTATKVNTIYSLVNLKVTITTNGGVVAQSILSSPYILELCLPPYTSDCLHNLQDICHPDNTIPWTNDDSNDINRDPSQCKCKEGWEGLGCHTPTTCHLQFVNLDQCNGRGYLEQISSSPFDDNDDESGETGNGNDDNDNQSTTTLKCNKVCTCYEGFSGPTCRQPTNHCDLSKVNNCSLHGYINGSINNGVPECDTKCTCDDGYTGDYCESHEICHDEQKNNYMNCNNRGVISYNSDSKTCSTSCKCNNPQLWTGITCSQPTVCEATFANENDAQNETWNQCGIYGYIPTTDSEPTTTSCLSSCQCLFGFISETCDQCPYQCFGEMNNHNPQSLCRDVDGEYDPCICKGYSIGPYCQYNQLSLNIQLNNMIFPQWVLDAVDSLSKDPSSSIDDNVEMMAFIDDIIYYLNGILGYPLPVKEGEDQDEETDGGDGNDGTLTVPHVLDDESNPDGQGTSPPEDEEGEEGSQGGEEGNKDGEDETTPPLDYNKLTNVKNKDIAYIYLKHIIDRVVVNRSSFKVKYTTCRPPADDGDDGEEGGEEGGEGGEDDENGGQDGESEQEEQGNASLSYSIQDDSNTPTVPRRIPSYLSFQVHFYFGENISTLSTEFNDMITKIRSLLQVKNNIRITQEGNGDNGNGNNENDDNDDDNGDGATDPTTEREIPNNIIDLFQSVLSNRAIKPLNNDDTCIPIVIVPEEEEQSEDGGDGSEQGSEPVDGNTNGNNDDEAPRGTPDIVVQIQDQPEEESEEETKTPPDDSEEGAEESTNSASRAGLIFYYASFVILGLIFTF